MAHPPQDLPHPPAPTPALVHGAFYRFVRLAQPDRVAHVLRELTCDLKGSVLVAEEGLNGTVAGTAAAVDAFELALQDDPRLHGLFTGLKLQRTPGGPAPFGRMKVHRRAEILALGVEGIDAVGHHGRLLEPAEWEQALQQPGLVLIDNRNSFEVRLGHFRGAIDPQVHNFRDFPQYIEAHAAQWRDEGRPVAMYCTGGIRCEKTAAWMAGMGIEVLQLRGGILNYLATAAQPERWWQGECFVFDNRMALDARLQPTGTPPEAIFGETPDEQWRLQRARRLQP